MRYGYFDNQRREYVITRPDTPTPWINYLGNGGFGGIISNTGGGLSFDGDPSNRRVTRYKFNNQPIDRPGRYLYIRDEEKGEYWSPTWQPVMKTLESYECRHGLGYTVITGRYADVETEITYSVPPQKRYELWQVRLTNHSLRPRSLRLFSYVEFSWNDAKYDMLCHWPSMAFKADFQDGYIVVDTVAEQLTGKPLYDYIATTLPVDGYDCSLTEFIGPYRDESCPIAVEEGHCRNSAMYSDNCVGVLSSTVKLQPGEVLEFCYTLGATDDRQDIAPQIADAFSAEVRDHALEKLHATWDDYRSCLQVDTPCTDMNTMLNIWHAYQAKTTFDWSRFISLYERGVDRGFGFRDSMQDVLGIMHARPEEARARIRLLLSIQCADGSARSVYYPATGQSEGGGRSDDHLWSVLSVCNYIRETGRLDFLKERIPYVDGGEATVLEHLEQGIRFTMAHLGRHGIPDMLKSDWDDSLAPMNRGGTGGAESVFVFFQLAHAAWELLELYRFAGLSDRKPYMEQVYAHCKSKLDLLWDGEWFIRAFTPEGKKYCTHEDTCNKIHLIPQAWSILSRLADAQRADLAMDKVMEYLYTENGLITHYPASEGFSPADKSYFLFPAGARENGGIFFHSNTWVIIAYAMLGRGEDAFRCYESCLPPRRNDRAEICLTEPYVYSQTMLAPPHPRAGACVNSWLTGTASWTYLAATQYILGIRPDYQGLRIDPQIPDFWPGFTLQRICRGTRCRITVKRCEGGEMALTADGEALSENWIPWERLQGRKEISIELVLPKKTDRRKDA